MNKVYTLSHKHTFEDEHIDEKLIGVFSSKDEALNELENYKKLEGFRDYLGGFYIQECVIDKIDNSVLNELIKTLQSDLLA
ncbi:MAG: hypothetical protein K940chlam8_00790 [Chlamydiae bacterium]|nr:hypothetical protein [Chlamydiota bacterium]